MSKVSKISINYFGDKMKGELNTLKQEKIRKENAEEFPETLISRTLNVYDTKIC